MKSELVYRYTFAERTEISKVVENLNRKLICRRPEGVEKCSVFRPQKPRTSIEYGKVPLSDKAFKLILKENVLLYSCPLDKLAVVSDHEMYGDKGLFSNRPWPGNKGNWVRCKYEENSVYWYQGISSIVKSREELKGWIPSWTIPYLNLSKLKDVNKK